MASKWSAPPLHRMSACGDDQPISKAWMNGRFGKKQTHFFYAGIGWV
jgi:hypothetical protein